MSFATQLKSATGQVNEAMNTTWKRSVAQAFAQTIVRTPVDTGAARASWLLGQNNDGAVGTQQLNITTQKIPDIGGSVLMYSNLPYIERLENGWSQQAPQGMVRITEQQWPGIVRANRL